MKKSFSYRNITEKDIPQIREWLSLPHISKWIHGEGLKSTLRGMKRCLEGSLKPNRYWIASQDSEDFALLFAGERNQNEEELQSVSFVGEFAVSLDIFIPNKKFIGKGLAPYLICDFLLRNFPEASDFVIDPEQSNTRAVHVYEKVGFQKTGDFIASWYPVPHWMMHVSKEDLEKKFQEIKDS